MFKKIVSLSLMLLLLACGQSVVTPAPQGVITTPSVVPVVLPDTPVPSLEPGTALAEKCKELMTDVPVNVVLTADKAPPIGGNAVIEWLVCSDWDMPSIHGFLELPEGISLVDGTADWQGSLRAGGFKRLSATIQVTAQGQLDIRGVVQTQQEGGDSWSAVDHLYFTVTPEGSIIGLPSDSGQTGATQSP